jgi:hypothetical protein
MSGWFLGGNLPEDEQIVRDMSKKLDKEVQLEIIVKIRKWIKT